jgi:uncharacterized protein YukE
VEKLEKTVESLAEVPGEVRRLGRRLVRVEARLGAVELQFLQHRAEVKGEFSAVRRELTQTRNDLLQVIDSSSQATQGMFDDLSKRTQGMVDDLWKGTQATQRKVDDLSKETHGMFDGLSKEIRDLADHTRSQFGEVIDRLSRLSDGGFQPPQSPPPTR